MQAKVDSPHSWLLFLAFLTHLLTAIFSTGYDHFDEHFQIIEFMNLKLGGTTESAMPWDYGEKIRQWIMPWFFYGLKKVAEVFTSSPASTALFFRLFSAALGFLSSYLLYLVTLKNLPTQRTKNWAFAFLFLTWFIPYIHVRTSAENYSAIFFIFAISILFLKNPSLVFNRGSLKEVSFSSLLLTGVFCGLSFVCRYQMSIPVFFLFLWMIFSRQFQVKHLFTFIIGNLFVLAFSSAIDIISYDEWLFVPWNYFHLNLIEGVAARFSKDPLWFFLKSPLERGFPPVSLFLMIGSFLFWWRNPRNVWTWVTLPFFLAHSLISHKEIRFLNFLYLMTPFLTLFSLAHFLELKKTWQRVSWKLILFVNTAVLVAVCFRSPRLAVNFYDKIQEVRPQSMKLDQANNPFVQVAGLVPHFYLPHLPEITEDSPYVFVEQATVWKKYYQNPHCQLKYSSSPVWIFKWKLDDVLKRSRIWGLFYCPKEISSNEPKNG